MIHIFFVGDELDNWIKTQNWTLKEDGKVFICNQDAHIKSKNIAEKIDFDSKWRQCLSFIKLMLLFDTSFILYRGYTARHCVYTIIFLTFQVLTVTNINFLLMISIHKQEEKSWELIIWPPMGKCCDLSTNSLNWFYKEKYGSQCGEFVRGYWGLKG